MTGHIRILAPRLDATVIIDNDVVVRVAPMVSFMLGWRADEVREYARLKGWKTENRILLE